MFDAADLMRRTPSRIDDVLASLGAGRDRIVAHINPREAMILKALGGSGTINPRTGMLQFDDGDGMGSGGGDSMGGYDGGGGVGDGWGGFGEGFGGLGAATGSFASGIGAGYDTLGGYASSVSAENDPWGPSDYLGTWSGLGVDLSSFGLGDFSGIFGAAASTPGATDAIGGDVDAGWSTTGYQEGTPENAASIAGLESYGQATSPASYDKTDRGLDMISGFPGFSTMMNYAPGSMMGIGGFVGDPLGSLSSAAKGLGKAAGIAGLSSILGIAAAPVAAPVAAALFSAGVPAGAISGLYGLGTTAMGRSAYGGLEEAISNFDPGTVNMSDYATADQAGAAGESFGGVDLAGTTSLAGALESGSSDALSAPTAGIQATAAPVLKTNWKPYYSQLASLGRGGGQVSSARAEEAAARAKFNQILREAGYA